LLLLLVLLLLLPDVPDMSSGIYSKLRTQWTKLRARSDEVWATFCGLCVAWLV
jgi:hypothetical protein